MYFSLITSSILVVVWAILATIALYLIVLFALRYFNKYNVRNTWFILLSVFAIPFFVIEFSMAFALLKVKNTVVVEAQNYACSLAEQIDNVKEDNTTLDFIPENPVGMVLDKFPVLANFLDEHDISGNNATEIVNSVFVKTNNYILSLILGCLKWIGYFLLVQCSFSVLFGFLKKRRRERARKTN